MSHVDLVVTDLDGTLWHTADEVHPDVRAALRELEQRAIPLLVATGRRVTSTRLPLGSIGVAPPAVVLNGALALELATGKRFHWAPFDPAAAASVLAGFRTAGLEPCVYVDDDDVEVLVSEAPSTNPRHLESLGTTVQKRDLDAAVSDCNVLAFSIIGVPRSALLRAAEALAGIAEVHLNHTLDFPGMAAITVAPLRQSKWDGVMAFCRASGLDARRVLAVGDGPNDVKLLANAAIRVVPEGGHPEALALADHVVLSPLVGGWAEVARLV